MRTVPAKEKRKRSHALEKVRFGLSLWLFTMTLVSCTKPTHRPIQSEDERARQLSDEYWQEELRRSPLFASSLGERGHDAQLPDWSAEARAQTLDNAQRLRSALISLDETRLSAGQAVLVKVLTTRLMRRIKLAHCADGSCEGWSVDG